MFGVPVQTVKDLQRLLRCLFSFVLKLSPMSNEPFYELLVPISCVSSIRLYQTNLRIFAVLQEHLLLAHGVLIAYVHTCTHFNMQTQLSSRLQF